MRLNPLTFTNSKVETDPQGFINEMEKIFWVMHAIDLEGMEFSTYQLKVVSYQWYKG